MGEVMQKTIVKRLLMVQIFTNLTHFICPSIDSIIIGRFLGIQALAAVGCVNPLSLLLISSGATLAAGAQVHCGKALGMGSQKELNAALSSALITCAALSLVLVSSVLLFRFPLASLLTASGSAGLSADTANKFGYQITDTRRIPVMTINQILEQYCQSQFPDILDLDMEGMDLEILSQIDFSSSSPKIIVLETVQFGSVRKNPAAKGFLEKKGYIAPYETPINTLFVRRDCWEKML
jgi:hypothetical protein